MTIISKRCLLCLFLWALPVAAYLQVNDAGIWTGLGLEKELHKDFKLEAELETRFKENWSELATAFVDVSGRYDFSKHFRAALNYRFGNRQEDDDSYSLRQRWALDLMAKADIGEVGLMYRSRVQLSQRNLGNRENDVEFSNGWRHKLSADLKVYKKTELKISSELFSSEDEEGWYISDFRSTIGLSYKLKKRKYLSLGFLYQTELQANDPLSEYVIQLGYSLELK